MSPNLDNLLDAVSDERTFVNFIAALGADFVAEKALEWENSTVDTVFESAIAWANDTRDNIVDLANQNPWRRCAHIIYAGKFYE